MTLAEKTTVLHQYLNESPGNYRDSFKTDLILFFNEDFTPQNTLLSFLNSFNSESEIKEWVDLVTSQIVLKFDEEFETIGDFINEYVIKKKNSLQNG